MVNNCIVHVPVFPRQGVVLPGVTQPGGFAACAAVVWKQTDVRPSGQRVLWLTTSFQVRRAERLMLLTIVDIAPGFAPPCSTPSGKGGCQGVAVPCASGGGSYKSAPVM
jgi:hypothetical protein